MYRSAIITGASTGLGEEFARQLAPQCEQLVLVARRAWKLSELAAELREKHPHLDVLHFGVDLTKETERLEFIDLLIDHGATPNLLVNNAGMGDYGEFVSADYEKLDQMIQLNISALTHLTHAILPAMKRAGGGGIINVSSLASVLPIPDFAVYAATKAYVTSFSEAIRLEVRDDNISVQALCPGPVHTDFGKTAMREQDRDGSSFREAFYVPKEQVVREALAGLEADKARVYPGWKIGLAAAAITLLPIAAIRLIMSSRPRKD